MKNPEILRLTHVSKTYEVKGGGKLYAVSDVSLSICEGECVAVVGESGCGKSTLAKLITNVEHLDEGSIFFEKSVVEKLNKNDLKQYRRQVQMVFQDPSNAISPRMKIGRFLMEPWMQYEKKSRKEAKDIVLKSLPRVRLDESYFNKYPHELSGGELQRICIARSIALHPKLLVCDEATSALDVSIQKEIVSFLDEHKKEEGCSMLFITHDLALAENFSDRVAIMYLGKIVEILPGRALSAHAKHPYTKALLASVFSVHDRKEEPIHILPGEPPSPVNQPKGCVFSGRCIHATDLCREKTPELEGVVGRHQVACHKIHH